MALGLGDGAEIRTPMAITVIAGLSFSTVLTLVVIPTLYAGVDRLRQGKARLGAGHVLDEELSRVNPDQLAPELAGETDDDSEASS
jgi:HAE1 family hydrophobic/amphiphilic exporter-1